MPIQADQSRRKTVFTNPDKDPGRANQRWWLLPDEEKFKGVFAVCEDILTNLAVRRRMNYFFAALYNDTGAGFMASRNMNLYYNRTALDGNAMLNSSITINDLQNCIDTATAMIAKNKPKPQFATDNGTYKQKVRGQRLTKYVGGVFDEAKVYEKAQRIFTDACIYGTGAIKLYADEGKICCENLFIEELLIDDLEGMHECPTQIHQRKFRQRDELIAQFPEFKEEIQGADQVSGGSATFSTADIIPVIESWHLRSGPKAKDGAHTICIQNCTLFAEKYDKDYYPILFFRWQHQTLGFWGRGICHEVWKIQRELDIISQTIQRSQRLVSGPVIFCPNGSNITEDHLTSNKLAKVIEGVEAPQFLVPPSVQPELYEYQQTLRNLIYSTTGVPQNFAEGTKDPTLKSAVAQREQMDQATGRLQLAAQRWEELFLDIARVVVDMSADLASEDGSLSVLAGTRNGVERIEFKKARLDIKDYRLQLFPVSGLPTTPAGKLDQLMDYAQAGYLTKEQVMDIVDWQDLGATVSLEVAALRRAQQIISDIKEEGEDGYQEPGAYLNLPMAYRMACLAVSEAESEGVEEANIDLLQRWADAVHDLMDQATQQQAAAQQQAGPANQQQFGTAAQVGQTQQQQQPLPVPQAA